MRHARASEETKVQSIDDPGVLAAVSPHLDDAVAGCGALLAGTPGSTVITVFAGVPDAAVPLTEWDRRCGFGDGESAMKWRLGEDDKALHLLKAQPARLPFLDDQYLRAMERDAQGGQDRACAGRRCWRKPARAPCCFRGACSTATISWFPTPR